MTRRELLILTAAVTYGLLWIVCVVVAVGNVRAAPPFESPMTPATCCEAVPYLETP